MLDRPTSGRLAEGCHELPVRVYYEDYRARDHAGRHDAGD
jgi:hypothetical protein